MVQISSFRVMMMLLECVWICNAIENGSIDEFAIFNVALTEGDIKSIMTRGLKSISAGSTTDKSASNVGNEKCKNMIEGESCYLKIS